MIDPRYVRTMARYTSWQNAQLMPVLEAMSHEDVTLDRGAFFGSILATANHVLWGDMMWMSRFDPSVERPPGPPGGLDLHPTAAAWAADRFRMDGKIRFWSDGLRNLDLKGDLTWYSGMVGGELTLPLAETIVHLFNHQTHHRGQIHAMLTAAGQKAPVTDIALMPKDC